MLDTREYKVELEDGTMDRIFANKIAANIYSQVDDEGQNTMCFREIIDHDRDNTALTIPEQPGQQPSGKGKLPKMTKGWCMNVEMADESTHWIAMRDVKEANLVKLAEYAVTNGIDQEPVFSWWVPYTLKKRERIISKVKTKYWRTTHKYSV